MTRNTLSLDALDACVRAALGRAGACPKQAGPVARSIRQAEADDMRPIGLGYLPIYLAHMRSGRVLGQADPAVETPRPGLVMADAAHGFAHPAIEAGAPALLKAARACGIAAMAVRRSYSPGILGHCIEPLAAEGFVVLAWANSPPNMAAWGGRRKLFGTNPSAFASPRAGQPPLVVDLAATQVTKVALAAAARETGRVPEGWAFDPDGRPTTDGPSALAGSMAPAGGHKGAALALVVELLAAGLTGGAFSKDVSPYAGEGGAPPDVGQLIIALDASAFAPDYLVRIEGLFDAMLADEGVRLPGDRRLAARARAEREGVLLDEASERMLREAGGDLPAP